MPKKSKAKRKAYKSKRRAKKRNIKAYTQVMIFPSNRKTLPDRLHVTLFSSLKFFSSTLVGTAGAAATFNVNGTYLSNPWVTSGLGTTFIDYTAAVGGAGGGFAGTLSTGITATAPGFFAQLMDLYSFYFTKASSIDVKIDLDNGADEGQICIRPLSNVQGNSTSFKNVQDSRYAKSTVVGVVNTGNPNCNRLKNHMRTSTVLGYPIGDDKMTLEGGFVGTLGAGMSSPWNWQVMYQNNRNAASAGQIAFNVQMRYDVILFQPQLYNT